MKKVLVIIFLLMNGVLFGQKYSAAIKLQTGIPQGDFRQSNDNVGLGGRFNFLYKPDKQIPISFGADIGYQVIGRQSKIFRTSLYGFFDEYRLTASNNILSVMLNMRIAPVKNNAAVQPFIDGLFGWNDFFSTVSLERITFNNSSGGQNTNSSKARWALAYGGGAGLNIRLNKKEGLFIELKTSYLVGNKTKYLTDPVFYSDGSIGFTEKESKTDMLIPQAGVRFIF